MACTSAQQFVMTGKISGERALNFSLKPKVPDVRARFRGPPGGPRSRLGSASLLAVSLTAALAGCSGSEGSRPKVGRGADGGSCRVLETEDPPALELPAALPAPPTSEVWLSIDVPLAVIQREVERHVPRTLAAERDRPIGGPGQVTYRVTRGTPKLRASAGEVTATLPVEIDLSLCKPLGGLCIGYGSCTPKYEVNATVDLTLDAAHELPDVRLSQKVKEGCRVGVDVTEHVTRVVKDQLADVERRIRNERPGIAPWVDRAITELTRPTMLAVGQCVALAPDAVLLDGPTTNGDHLTWGIGVRGTIAESECTAPPHRGRGLPISRPTQPRPAPSVELREHIDEAAFSEALGAALSAASGPELGFTLVESELARDQVAFMVDLRGPECGRVWALAKVGTRGDQLTLEDVHLLAGRLDAERRKELERALAVALDLRTAAPRFLEDLALTERTSILETLLDQHAEVDLHVDAPAVRRATVVPAPDGLWVLSQVASELHLEARASGSARQSHR